MTYPSVLKGGFPQGWAMLLLPLALAACQSEAIPADDVRWNPPALTDDAFDPPDPVDVVRNTVEFMSGHQVVGYEALVTYEAVQETGQKLQFEMLQRMAIQKPDRLFWVVLHDNGTADSAWYHDGEFTMLKQPANAWGRIRVPPTIPEAVDRLVNEYDLDVPFADILSGNLAALWLGEDVLQVEYLGEAWVEGFWTEHIGVRLPGFDLEMWLRKGDEPFPMKFAIVYTEVDGMPTYTARFRKWVTVLPEGAIPEFTPPPDAERVEVVPFREW